MPQCRFRDGESWASLLKRHGQARKHTHVLLVARKGHGDCLGQSRSRGKDGVEISVLLTRKGTWLLWRHENYPGEKHSVVNNEYLAHHDSVRELCADFLMQTPEEFRWWEHGEHGPLGIERGLRQLLEITITEREKRLVSMKSALDSANRRVAIVH